MIPDRTSYPYNGYTIISTNPLPPLTSLYLGSRRTLSLRNGWNSKIEAEQLIIKGEKGDSNFGTTLTCGGAGSGGSIYISCDTIEGTGSVNANGGGNTSSSANGAGGGGRIALWYRTSAFGGVNPTNVFTVSAAGGAGLVATESDKKDGLPGSIYVHQIRGLMLFVR